MTFGAELSFKLAFGALFAAVLACALRAAFQMKRAGRNVLAQAATELLHLKVLRTALGAVFYGAVALWLFDFDPPALSLDLPPSVRWLGAVVAGVAVVIVWRSIGALGRNYASGVALFDDHALVTHGPYAVVRHPVYASFIAIQVGAALITSNWLIGGDGVLLTTLFAALRVGPEERLLAARFGDAYTAWRRNTPALIPRVFRRSTKVTAHKEHLA